MAEAKDEAHLRYATVNGLALITKDADFRHLHFSWLQQGINHEGIFFCADRQSAAVGKIVTACYRWYELIDMGAGTLDDIRNRLFEID